MVSFLYVIGALSLALGLMLGLSSADRGARGWEVIVAMGIGSGITCFVLAKFLSVLEEIRDRLPAPKTAEPKPSKAEIVAAAQSLGEEQ